MKAAKEMLPTFGSNASAPKQCKRCDHPRPEQTVRGCIRSSFSLISASAARGCLPCSVLSDGINEFFQGNDLTASARTDELRVDFDMGARDMEVIFLGTPARLAFHRPTSL